MPLINSNGSPLNQGGIQFTSLRTKDGRIQAKHGEMVNGVFVKSGESIPMSEGFYKVYTLQSLKEFLGSIGVAPYLDTTLCYGVPVSGLTDGLIVTKAAFRRAMANPTEANATVRGAMVRGNEALQYRKGQPGIFLGDIDPDPSGKMKGWTAHQLDDFLCSVLPWLRNYDRGYLPSGGSGVYDMATGNRVDTSEGWRLYFVVDDASLIPALGHLIFAALVDAGHGFGFVTRNGNRYVRTLFDRAVWQGSRLDFAFGIDLAAGLVQRRPVTFFNGLAMVPAAATLRAGGMQPLLDMKALREYAVAWEKKSAKFKAVFAAMADEAKGSALHGMICALPLRSRLAIPRRRCGRESQRSTITLSPNSTRFMTAMGKHSPSATPSPTRANITA